MSGRTPFLGAVCIKLYAVHVHVVEAGVDNSYS